MPTVTKKVKGKKYLYFTYYDQQTGKKKEVYCGVETNSASKKKALELELQYLRSKIIDYSKEADSIEKQILKIK